MSNQIDLLPCPFCGARPTESSHYISSGGDTNKIVMVKCEHEPCRVKPSVGVCGPGGYKSRIEWMETMESNEAAKTEAYARWNKRT